MDKAEFIDYFISIIKNVLYTELPPEAEENDFIEKAYDICYKKIRHIKINGYEEVR